MGRLWLSGTLIPYLLTLSLAALLAGCQSHSQPSNTGNVPGGPGLLPELASKPQPVGTTFKGCPPEGRGGDPVLNWLKNRVDDGAYYPVAFEAVAQLSWPKTAEYRRRDEWSSADTMTISHYEGVPLMVEGYLAEVTEQGPEACNCYSQNHDMRDFHLWLTGRPTQDRSQSIIVEVTPRLRAVHSAWQLENLRNLARDQVPVRISGWLMFDPDHPDLLGKTRGTLWELHPVMRIEVQQQGGWVQLQ